MQRTRQSDDKGGPVDPRPTRRETKRHKNEKAPRQIRPATSPFGSCSISAIEDAGGRQNLTNRKGELVNNGGCPLARGHRGIL